MSMSMELVGTGRSFVKKDSESLTRRLFSPARILESILRVLGADQYLNDRATEVDLYLHGFGTGSVPGLGTPDGKQGVRGR